MINRQFYILICLLFLVLNCQSNKNEQNKIKPEKEIKDSIPEVYKFDYSQYSDYKISSNTNGYGKMVNIDSLHFKVFRRYYVQDSTRLRYERFKDIVNDTLVMNEYYYNGNIKEVEIQTSRYHIPYGKSLFYNKDGTIKKVVDYSKNFPLKFDEIFKIIDSYEVRKPLEFRIASDSINMWVLNWVDTTPDSLEYGGTELGKGIVINMITKKVEPVEINRRYEN